MENIKNNSKVELIKKIVEITKELGEFFFEKVSIKEEKESSSVDEIYDERITFFYDEAKEPLRTVQLKRLGNYYSLHVAGGNL